MTPTRKTIWSHLSITMLWNDLAKAAWPNDNCRCRCCWCCCRCCRCCCFRSLNLANVAILLPRGWVEHKVSAKATGTWFFPSPPRHSIHFLEVVSSVHVTWSEGKLIQANLEEVKSHWSFKARFQSRIYTASFGSLCQQIAIPPAIQPGVVAVRSQHPAQPHISGTPTGHPIVRWVFGTELATYVVAIPQWNCERSLLKADIFGLWFLTFGKKGLWNFWDECFAWICDRNIQNPWKLQKVTPSNPEASTIESGEALMKPSVSQCQHLEKVSTTGTIKSCSILFAFWGHDSKIF